MKEMVRLLQIANEAPDVKTFTLQRPARFDFSPGQYAWLSLPGAGRAPMAFSSGRGDEALQFTVRAWGDFTKRLFSCGIGEEIELDGPHGTSFPMARLGEGRAVYLIGGGTGVAPIRSLVRSAKGIGNVRVIYGVRDAASLIYSGELDGWQVDVQVVLEEAAAGWQGSVGNVVDQLGRCNLPSDAVAFVCGPKGMMQACVQHLRQRGVTDSEIYVSLERFDADGNVVGPVYPVSDPVVGF